MQLNKNNMKVYKEEAERIIKLFDGNIKYATNCIDEIIESLKPMDVDDRITKLYLKVKQYILDSKQKK